MWIAVGFTSSKTWFLVAITGNIEDCCAREKR